MLTVILIVLLLRSLHIGSLRLTIGVVLFDVLEYNVSLLFVIKKIKDSKVFVGFDEHKCYIQDLKLGKLVGTGSHIGGLYLFDVDKCGESNFCICNSTFVCHILVSYDTIDLVILLTKFCLFWEKKWF